MRIERSTALKVFAVLAFFGLCGLSVATLLVSRDASQIGRLSLLNNILRLIPLDGAWLGLIPASLLLLFAFRIPLSPGRVFAATAIPVALFLLFYSFAYVDVHTNFTPDSMLYVQPALNGTYSTFRSIGYPGIILAIHKTVGLDYLAWVQGTAAVACYMAGAWLLAARLGSNWAAAMLALPLLLQGALTRNAPAIMTEGLFMAALGIFAAALGALARRPSNAGAIAASFGIFLAISIKSNAAALILPALFLIRFLPKGRRLSVAGPVIVSGLAAFALVAATSYVRSGSLTERSSGFSLIGHVAWMLDDEAMPPSDLTRAMISAVKPVLEQRPSDLGKIDSIAALDRYVDVTTGDYNTLLWQKVAPLTGITDRADAFLLSFALSSIRAHPWLYARHVAAHFYGMWRYLGVAGHVWPLRSTAIAIRSELPVLDERVQQLISPGLIAPYPDRAVAAADATREANLPLIATAIFSTNWLTSHLTIAAGLAALVLSVLFLIPSRLTNIYRAEIMMALSINAYFGGHVLLQVTLPRYATGASLAALLFGMSFIITTLRALGIGDRLSSLVRCMLRRRSQNRDLRALVD